MAKKRIKRKVAKKPARRAKALSARTIQDLRKLSEQIGEIIPATAFPGNGFCLKNIATANQLGKFWPKAKNATTKKKEVIYSFLKEVYSRHPRVFKKIFRENIARGIERRSYNGKLVLEAEIMALSDTLYSLGIDLKSEIAALNLPKDRPSIVPPPPEFRTVIARLGLHPFLLPDCEKLFKDGHINESVRKALEKFEVYVQKKSSLQSQGTDLMATAFNEQNPYIRVADTTKRGIALQCGFKFLAMGTMGFWRNLLSHGDEKQMPHQDALAVLGTVSHMMNVVDAEPPENMAVVAKAVAEIVTAPLQK